MAASEADVALAMIEDRVFAQRTQIESEKVSAHTIAYQSASKLIRHIQLIMMELSNGGVPAVDIRPEVNRLMDALAKLDTIHGLEVHK